MLLKSTLDATDLFGREVCIYAPIINSLGAGLDQETYEFLDTVEFADAVSRGELTQGAIGKIFWFEILQRARLVSNLSIIRTANWIEACVREHQAGALAPFTACCRALVEATGDSCDSLNFVALTLAEQSMAIRRELAGHGIGIVSSELEDILIHFTHARKLPKGSAAPISHKAKHTAAYIDVLTGMGLPKAASLYAALCERMHPAEAGLSHYYASDPDGGFRLTLDGEGAALEAFVVEHRETLHGLLPLAFNPAILTLRVCGTFGLWEVPRALEEADFSRIPIWQRIADALAPITGRHLG